MYFQTQWLPIFLVCFWEFSLGVKSFSDINFQKRSLKHLSLVACFALKIMRSKKLKINFFNLKFQFKIYIVYYILSYNIESAFFFIIQTLELERVKFCSGLYWTSISVKTNKDYEYKQLMNTGRSLKNCNSKMNLNDSQLEKNFIYKNYFWITK